MSVCLIVSRIQTTSHQATSIETFFATKLLHTVSVFEPFAAPESGRWDLSDWSGSTHFRTLWILSYHLGPWSKSDHTSTLGIFWTPKDWLPDLFSILEHITLTFPTSIHLALHGLVPLNHNSKVVDTSLFRCTCPTVKNCLPCTHSEISGEKFTEGS